MVNRNRQRRGKKPSLKDNLGKAERRLTKVDTELALCEERMQEGTKFRCEVGAHEDCIGEMTLYNDEGRERYRLTKAADSNGNPQVVCFRCGNMLNDGVPVNGKRKTIRSTQVSIVCRLAQKRLKPEREDLVQKIGSMRAILARRDAAKERKAAAAQRINSLFGDVKKS